MTEDAKFRIRYWGTTGSFTKALLADEILDKIVGATAELVRRGVFHDLAGQLPDEVTIRERIVQHVSFPRRSTFGGNTSCIEVETADSLIIVDGGSGFRELGRDLMRRWNAADYEGPRSAHVIFTHPHMDHTHATPFVDPFHDARSHFKFWGPRSVLDGLDLLLNPSSKLANFYFPIDYSHMTGIKEFQAVEAGEEFHIGDTCLCSFALNHPGGCVAYRLQRGERRLVFASDHEHVEVPDRGLAEFARGADLLYSDAQYTREEYEGKVGIDDEPPLSRVGWGHSPFDAAIATAVEAGVRLLHLGHHEPKRRDEQLFALEQTAQSYAQDLLRQLGKPEDGFHVCLAYEGLTVDI